MTAKQRMAQHPAEILRVEDLTIRFRRQAEQVTVVNQLSLTVKRGETLALVGESGSGKSVTSVALIGLLPVSGRKSAGLISP